MKHNKVLREIIYFKCTEIVLRKPYLAYLTRLKLIVIIVVTIICIVLYTTIPVKQVAEAQNAVNIIDSAGNQSWILDKITNTILSRMPHQ